jgi:hypothetical protein
VSSRPCRRDKQPRARFHPESTEVVEASFALFRSSCADPCPELCTEPRFKCCKQALAQACAVCSPFCRSMCVMAIFRQPRKKGRPCPRKGGPKYSCLTRSTVRCHFTSSFIPAIRFSEIPDESFRGNRTTNMSHPGTQPNAISTDMWLLCHCIFGFDRRLPIGLVAVIVIVGQICNDQPFQLQ